jgi:chemotaxis protein CheD
VNLCLGPVAGVNSSHGQAEEHVYLYPGALWAGQEPAVITTVLGSCVSVCLWSRTVAGINHFILPWGGSTPSARFGNHALPMLLDNLRELSADTRDLYAAIFGGASLLGGRNSSGPVPLGRRNLIEAREFLARHEIPVVREDVGGDKGRKLTFRTFDGTTIVRKL